MTSTAQGGPAQSMLSTRRLKAGMVLTLIGAAAGALGSIIAGLEVAVATRRWLNETGYPPSEVARTKLHQALLASQAATHAAVEAWQHEGQGHPVGAGVRDSAG